MKNPWFVYIIQTQKGKLYTGITTDVERRFIEHRDQKKKGAKYFRSDRPVKVVHCEQHENRSKASKRESEIKKMSRKQKLDLIS